jgi:hypothetical protein
MTIFVPACAMRTSAVCQAQGTCPEELTSRKSGSDIPMILSGWSSLDKASEAQRAADRKEGKRPSAGAQDVVVATNMISVGVDIERLGLMLVAGQPKNTPEYIQATSRSTLHGPNRLCTVFNWARPRDLSHYELLNTTTNVLQACRGASVTPFPPCLDRGLSGVMVAHAPLGRAAQRESESGRIQDTDPFARGLRPTSGERNP